MLNVGCGMLNESFGCRAWHVQSEREKSVGDFYAPTVLKNKRDVLYFPADRADLPDAMRNDGLTHRLRRRRSR